ncbi:MAG: nucleotidyltransferase domain-containing protein [archaeon]|nr:nucleotidyltransferase domain-containing protein [archaeon]
MKGENENLNKKVNIHELLLKIKEENHNFGRTFSGNQNNQKNIQMSNENEKKKTNFNYDLDFIGFKSDYESTSKISPTSNNSKKLILDNKKKESKINFNYEADFIGFKPIENHPIRKAKDSFDITFNTLIVPKDQKNETKDNPKSARSRNNHSEEIVLSDSDDDIKVEEAKISPNFYDHDVNLKDLRYNKVPWITKATAKLDGRTKLHSEIVDFYNFMKSNDKDEEKVLEIKNFLEEKIKSEYPSYKLEMYGSRSTGLAVPNSDIDFCIVEDEEYINDWKLKQTQNSKPTPLNKLPENKKEALAKIKKVLTINTRYEKLIFINAKVPIINLEMRGLSVDISFAEPSSLMSIDFVKKSLKAYPMIKPLLLLIKFNMKQKELNSPSEGYINSNCLFSMILFRLMKLSEEGKKISDLGTLFLDFLEFWGIKFNYRRVGVSLREGGFYFNEKDNSNFYNVFHENKSAKYPKLIFENILDIKSNIAATSTKFNEIAQEFREIYGTLIKNKKYFRYLDPETEKISLLRRFINLDELLMKRREFLRDYL